jgi:hypothetical protein
MLDELRNTMVTEFLIIHIKIIAFFQVNELIPYNELSSAYEKFNMKECRSVGVNIPCLYSGKADFNLGPEPGCRHRVVFFLSAHPGSSKYIT